MTRINKIRLLLLVVILLVYGQVVTHDFVDWDDGQHIYLNKNIVEHSPTGLLHHWEPSNPGNPEMYCPMVFTVWWSLAHLSDVQSPDLLGATLNPYIFHAANLLVHWLCACVVLEILLRLKIRPWAAAAGALVFAVHPLQTEAVAWASAMKDLLSGLFALLSIWRYIAALEAKGRQRKWNYWISTIFYAAALLSKPSTVIVPAIAGAIDLILYRRPWKDVFLWTLPWYLMAIVIIRITENVQRFPQWVGGPMWAHPLIALDALAFYLYKLVLPISLRFDYGRSPYEVLMDPKLHHPIYWSWIVPVATAVLIWRMNRKLLTLAGAIFLLGVLPVLGLKAFAYQYFTTVADRYVYLSMLGVAVAVGWWIEGHRSRGTAIIAAVVITILASLSFVQAQRWSDTETLYVYALNDSQPMHQTIYGQYQDDLAMPYFRRAALASQHGDIDQEKELTSQGIAFVEKAMSYYRTAIRLGPTDTHAYDLLARDLVRMNQIPEAIDIVSKWIIVEPRGEFAGREKPGRLQGMLGSLYLANHQFPEAVAALKKSLAEQSDPDIEKTLAAAQKLAAQAAGSNHAPRRAIGSPTGRLPMERKSFQRVKVVQ